MNEFRKSFFQQMRPKFHEITMYLIALSFCWLLMFHPEFGQGFLMFFTGFGSLSPVFLALGLIVTSGLFLSLAHVFIKRKKLALEKALMGWFVLGISGVSSFVVGSEMLASRSAIMMVFVVWNILMSILMLVQMATQEFDISDENATFLEVLVSTGILFVILLFIDKYLHLSWAMTLSICIFYSTSIVFLTTWVISYFDIKIPAILKK